MKAVVQDLSSGKLQLEDVPPPAVQPGGVLVRVHRSLISLGTEKAVIALANKSLIGKAKDRPDLVRKVLNKAKQEGLWNTYKVVKNLISSPIPLGYSSAGEVIEVGQAVTEFRIGDRVACAGLNYANHAEINYVPRNLVVKMPDGLSYDAACFVTIGAIAMQGIRLAEITLGEKVVIMGLGLVGQIAAQLARCAGATVLATDLEPGKVELAGRLGAHKTVCDAASLSGRVAELTSGHGADAVLICAATKSHELIQKAAGISRLKGRVIIIGEVGMHIERRAYYEKELRLVVSRSYGPGRYDPVYEAHGVDYPLPYVRWTEGRNMRSFLDLLARNDVEVESLITHRFPIEEAESAYQIVTGQRSEPAIAIALEYDNGAAPTSRVDLCMPSVRPLSRSIRLGVIGAGQFAKGILLPAFASQPRTRLHAFCTSSGFTSKNVAERYGANYCTSDPAEIFRDKDIDGVLIATRHNQHARLATEALRAGKAVFVEKPLATTQESLADLCAVTKSVEAPRLLVGFNRRFAPLALRCKEFFTPRNEPLCVQYRVNAGVVPADSWVLDPIEGGGRIIGEVCHFVDFICFLTDASVRRIFAESLGPTDDSRDHRGVVITLRMSDGSMAVIHYLANGDTAVPKEYVEVYGQTRTAILDNFRRLSMYRGNRCRRQRLFNQAKGYSEETRAFISALESGGPMPIDFATLVAATQTTFLIHRSLETGEPVDYVSPADETEVRNR
jgi:predicted dehydrogenase/threonine dehydrogenase-like Zn-dependent dehydrogenase